MRWFWMIIGLFAMTASLSQGQQLLQEIETVVSDGDLPVKPKLLHPVFPEYPDLLRKARMNGKCAVVFTVDAEGWPRDLHIVRCSDHMFVEPSLHGVTQSRFEPGKDLSGKAVPSPVTVEIKFGVETASRLAIHVRYSFGSPPGVTSTEADSNGVYPFTRIITPPKMAKYFDKGFEDAAFPHEGHSPCDVLMTIDASGKPSDAAVLQCKNSDLEKPAVASLLNSSYQPGLLQGKAIPVRVRIHLEYGETSDKN